jgi:hypothetical protein
MKTCVKCNSHYFHESFKRHHCKNHSVGPANGITGIRPCVDDCEYWEPDRSYLIYGMTIALGCAAVLFLWFAVIGPINERNRLAKAKAQQTMLAARQADALKAKAEQAQKNREQAKRPTVVYRGTIDGKPVELKGFHPYFEQ